MNAYGDSVDLLQAALVAGYGGQQVRDWANATTTTIAAAVQPRSSVELVDGRQVTTTGLSMHCAVDSGLRAVDRVVWRGTTYEVDGEPLTYSIGGTADHIEVSLQRVEEAA